MPPESMTYYGFKRAADDIKELARQLGVSQIILGGHDWYVILPVSHEILLWTHLLGEELLYTE